MPVVKGEAMGELSGYGKRAVAADYWFEPEVRPPDAASPARLALTRVRVRFAEALLEPRAQHAPFVRERLQIGLDQWAQPQVIDVGYRLLPFAAAGARRVGDRQSRPAVLAQGAEGVVGEPPLHRACQVYVEDADRQLVTSRQAVAEILEMLFERQQDLPVGARAMIAGIAKVFRIDEDDTDRRMSAPT